MAGTAVEELDLPLFDYLDPQLRGEQLHRVVRDLRERGWLARAPIGYVVLDREAAEFFLRAREAVFPGLKIAELFGVPEGPLLEQIRRNILNLTGDSHRRLRNLVNPFFTPRAADRRRPLMRELLAALWEKLSAEKRCEAVGALCEPYPAQAIARVVGAPLADAPLLERWSGLIQQQFDGPALLARRDEIERACAEFYEYCAALIAERRARPRDDLVSELVRAEQEGDRLSDVECMNLVLNVLVGGVETTQAQLAHALRLFATHPKQWQLLAERPELAGRAVEEVLRFEPVTPFTARLLERDIEFRGVRFPAGTVVMVCQLAANRDGVPGDPERFDIARPPGGPRTLAFGAGIHYCLGANLARVELEEALAFLAPRMPDLALDGEVVLGTVHGVYGVEQLPLRWR